MAIIRVTNVPSTALSDDVITSAKIADGTIAVSDLANDSVTAEKIASNAVTSTKIADSNITTAKIADSNITTTKVADGAITTGHMHSSVPLGTKNLIINGAMQVWQRGITLNVTSTDYAADRWQTQGQIWTGTRSTDVPAGFEYSLDITSNNTGYGSFGQRIEAKNCKHLVGKDVTLSFYSKSISGETNCYVLLKVPGAEDDWTSSSNISQQVIGDIGSTWTRHSFTFTNLPSSVANGLLVMIFHAAGVATQRRFTGFQLEVGDVTTEFEHIPFDMQLLRCQRYYQIMPQSLLHGISSSGSLIMWNPFVEMRKRPTLIYPTSVYMEPNPWAVAGGITNVTLNNQHTNSRGGDILVTGTYSSNPSSTAVFIIGGGIGCDAEL